MGITIERVLPERGERGVAAAPAGQCCCCCCCCLHSVGGVLAAVTTSPKPPDPVQLPVSTIGGPTREPRTSATGLYWAAVGLVSCLGFVYFTTFARRRADAVESALLLGFLFPLVQIAASVVAAIVIGFSRRPGKDVRLRHLGRITLRSVLGALVGVLIMLPLLLGKC